MRIMRIAPERLLRALLLQVLSTVRSERQVMEQLDHKLLFRWFVGLNADDPVWDPTATPGNPTVNFRGERRSNETHERTSGCRDEAAGHKGPGGRGRGGGARNGDRAEPCTSSL
jgi:hypothetical protein